MKRCPIPAPEAIPERSGNRKNSRQRDPNGTKCSQVTMRLEGSREEKENIGIGFLGIVQPARGHVGNATIDDIHQETRSCIDDQGLTIDILSALKRQDMA